MTQDILAANGGHDAMFMRVEFLAQFPGGCLPARFYVGDLFGRRQRRQRLFPSACFLPRAVGGP